MSDKNFRGKHGPLLIAEIGGNHEGDFDDAKKLVDLAFEADVDLIKFQIYEGDTIVNKRVSPKRNKHFKKFELTREQHLKLAEYVEANGFQYTASIWDMSFIDWIDKHIPIYKIGSGDLTAYPLLSKIAKLGKPIIISTGLSSEREVLDAIEFIQNQNSLYEDPNYLGVLQCTSMYPISDKDAHLNVIPRLKQLTGLTTGYSDHTIGFDALRTAYSLGAEILEFHFTDTRKNKDFRDHKVSLTAEEVQELIKDIERINDLKGDPEKKLTNIEIDNGHHESFRRAVYPKTEIAEGTLITEDHLTVLRPLKGIDARNYYDIIGKRATTDLEKFQILKHEYFR